MGLFGGLVQKISRAMGLAKIDDGFFDELEEQLIMADVGAATALALTAALREEAKRQGLDTPEACEDSLRRQVTAMLSTGDQRLHLADTGLSVVLFLGVNGVGKTTTIAKLAYKLKNEGKHVVVAAADTFRAAAADQLAIWCERAGVDLIRQHEGVDPGSVV